MYHNKNCWWVYRNPYLPYNNLSQVETETVSKVFLSNVYTTQRKYEQVSHWLTFLSKEGTAKTSLPLISSKTNFYSVISKSLYPFRSRARLIEVLLKYKLSIQTGFYTDLKIYTHLDLHEWCNPTGMGSPNGLRFQVKNKNVKSNQLIHPDSEL